MDLVALAPKDFTEVLREEVCDRILDERGRLFLLRGLESPLWAQNIWLEPQIFKFQSISQAARHLRSLQRNWWLHETGFFRRAELIRAQLPPFRPKPLAGLARAPGAPLGHWTLLDETSMLYSAKCSSPFPDGEVEFDENKLDPPSRAYLKLWEFFALNEARPTAQDRVMDLGSSPGGWTWALKELGCRVISVDKAPLAESLAASPQIEHRLQSAFSLEPEPVDWLFCDVICYPERLLQLVLRWLPFARHMVCSIKFQGPTNFAVLREFMKIPGSHCRHLSCNKHELTWSR